MAIIYYPGAASTLTRQISGGQMVELFIGVAPDQIIVLSGSVPATASIDFITASYAQTASFAANGGGGSSLDEVATVLLVQFFS